MPKSYFVKFLNDNYSILKLNFVTLCAHFLSDLCGAGFILPLRITEVCTEKQEGENVEEAEGTQMMTK